MIEAIRVRASLEQPDENGKPQGIHVRARAAKGDAASQALLDAADDTPECLDYLLERFWRLDGMRERSSMGDRMRLTPLQILGACELFGWTLTELEAEALVLIDIAWLAPPKTDEDEL